MLDVWCFRVMMWPFTIYSCFTFTFLIFGWKVKNISGNIFVSGYSHWKYFHISYFLFISKPFISGNYGVRNLSGGSSLRVMKPKRERCWRCVEPNWGEAWVGVWWVPGMVWPAIGILVSAFGWILIKGTVRNENT